MSTATDAKHVDLHFVIIPLMASGHTIPMVDIARLLARRPEVTAVTILTTHFHAQKIKPLANRIRIAEIEFPPKWVSDLPTECQTMDLLPTMYILPFLKAVNTLGDHVQKLLDEMSPKPSCIISDSFFSWASKLASENGVPRIVFEPPGCFTLLCNHNLRSYQTSSPDLSDRFVVPGLPHRIELTYAQAGITTGENANIVSDLLGNSDEAEKSSLGIVVNSFEELDLEYTEELAKAKQGKQKVWCVGPVSLVNNTSSSKMERGHTSSITEQECTDWLDSRGVDSSVLYVCRGSGAPLSTAQAIELGLGLELSEAPFIWCIGRKAEGLEKWLASSGFEERVKGRGLVIHGWAPQTMILSHPAVGGFLTHCGWNSTMEGVSAGVPMITWPQFADQFLNESFVVEVVRIGVRVGVEVSVYVGQEEEVGVLVNRDEICKVVEKVMDRSDEEAIRRRERAKKLGEAAKKAMEEGGSSHRNLTKLIQDVLVCLN